VHAWEASSLKVTSRTQCSRFSIVQCPRSQLGGAGRAEGQAGDRVHGDGAPAAAAGRADTAGGLDPLGGVRKAQAGHGRDLQGPDLDPPMAMITGAVHDRDLAPRQSGELGVQGWLVGLDDQQVVGAAVDEETGVVALGVRRVGGDHHTGKVQAGQQRRKHRDLVGGGGHVPLGDHAAVVVARRCQEMHLVAVTTRAAQPLAVNRDHAAVAWPVQPVSQPRADGGIHRVAVHPCEHPAYGRLAGDVAAAGERVTAHPKRGQDRPGRVSGPLGDRGHTPGRRPAPPQR
jgi:hypothetical protein